MTQNTTNQKPATRVKCKATSKSTGKQCRNDPIKGGTVCRMHGGSARQVRKKAAINHEAKKQHDRIERTARRLGAHNPDLDPTQALLHLIRTTAAEVEWYRQRIDELDTDRDLIWGTFRDEEETSDMGIKMKTVQGPGEHMWLKLYRETRRDLAKFITEALRVGIEERRVRNEEFLATQLVEFANKLAGRLGITDMAAYREHVQAVFHELAAAAEENTTQ